LVASDGSRRCAMIVKTVPWAKIGINELLRE
jgi:hypothetical protein